MSSHVDPEQVLRPPTGLPVHLRWSVALRMEREASAVERTRVFAQRVLMAAEWGGHPLAAVRIVAELVDNAVTHGGEGPVVLALSAGADGALLVSVSDTDPKFSSFQAALAAAGTGFDRVRGVGGEISWCRQPDGSGKAVWARLPVIAADVGRGPVSGPPVQHDC